MFIGMKKKIKIKWGLIWYDLINLMNIKKIKWL
jgi:hypothetical protein